MRARWPTLLVSAALAGVGLPLLALLGTGSCSLEDLYRSADASDEGAGSSSASGSASGTASASASASSGSGDAGGTGGAGAGGSGGSGGGAPACPKGMMLVPKVGGGTFCIDDLEVTNSEYAKFLATNPKVSPGPPGKCDWNTSFTALVPPDAGLEKYPVLGVDWCDAYAYCAFKSKHLCGAVEGGPVDFKQDRNTVHDEWLAACSANAAQVYPYPGVLDLQKCSDCDPDGGCTIVDAAAPLHVGEKPECQGGYPGIFDLSGNAWEWESSCDDGGLTPDAADEAGKPIVDPRYDTCSKRGGAFDTPHPGVPATCLQCAACSSAQDTRKSRRSDIGFRCCQ